MTPAEALAAWESDTRLQMIIRQCHPCYGSADITVASDADPDLLGMVTCCAVAARRQVSVVACGTALDLLAALQWIARYSAALGCSITPEMHATSVLVRIQREEVAA